MFLIRSLRIYLDQWLRLMPDYTNNKIGGKMRNQEKRLRSLRLRMAETNLEFAKLAHQETGNPYYKREVQYWKAVKKLILKHSLAKK